MSILNGIRLKDDETVHQLDWENGVGNKPFYTEEGEQVELLPNQELTFSIEDGSGQCILDNVIELVEGQTYKVNYDGVEYDCVCGYMEMEVDQTTTYKFWAIGNTASLGGEDNGVPFAVTTNDDGTTITSTIMSIDENTTHTVRIYQGGEIVHQLDSKFVNAYTKEETENLIANTISSALNTEV